MSELEVLAAVREHLLNGEAAMRVHLAVPPQAVYPLALIELEETWSNPCASGKAIQARVKFKVGVYSSLPQWREATLISDKVRHALEGATLWMPGNQRTTIRFLACVAEPPADKGRPLAMRHFYEAIVLGGER